jgi:hypothetical protein
MDIATGQTRTIVGGACTGISHTICQNHVYISERR